jgi:hypothetical protein
MTLPFSSLRKQKYMLPGAVSTHITGMEAAYLLTLHPGPAALFKAPTFFPA